ncbi:MAG: SUMF1/EgtB/PvdO family nonheme iron enzyme [Cyclobacteriaceae bacterium]|jgi:dienelactone hydrolase|nr:SUMF1/EgtB/PvdO family nonheme iron enzyme [Cyclobacteriaceae bacterium]
MASIIPDFEYDIFISYRQKDNKYDGWVTEFVENLKKELDATFKEDISIYFDSNAHDGLLETHNVNKSLEGKLKCIIFIPILSQTYCDTKSFAWSNELLPFLKLIEADKFGKSIKLLNGNIADRFLPVRIHDLDDEDQKLFEFVTQSVLRPVDFIYRLPGVNRQLRAKDDEQIKSANQVLYRDQINKVARAIKDIINAMKSPLGTAKVSSEQKKETVAAPITVQRKEVNEQKKISSSKIKYISWIVPIVLLVAVGFWFVPQFLDKQRAKDELLPAIQKSIDENFRPPLETYQMAEEARKIIPNDSALIKLWARLTVTIPVNTNPEGAEVFWKDYTRPDMEWISVGTTPIKEATFKRNYVRLKFEKSGYQTVEYTGPNVYQLLGKEIVNVKMDSIGSLPENMVRIPAKNTLMYIVGVESYGNRDVGEFLIDKFEVTNEAFKKFVDAGGYGNRSFWKFPFYKEGKVLAFEEGIKQFVDRTGRQGPANWEAGSYPDDMKDHPVTGISWYEAAAFAESVGKKLPTIFHWSVAAETSRTEYIAPLSNFNGKGTTPVGSLGGVSTFGVYDIAGNAREWCSTETETQERFILGGGWNDPTYAFNDAYTQSPMDRSAANGFRCIKELSNDSTLTNLNIKVSMAFRNYRKEKPVDDKTFEIIKRQYAYDIKPLNDSVQQLAPKELATVEKITFDAAYNNERMQAYLYLPKNAKPPFQPIIFFPGSGDIYSRKYNDAIVSIRLDFILKSGRAIVIPIYKGTNERSDELKSDLQEETVFYKDHVIMWRKDIGRTIDYLETRKDIQADKVGYLGWSWGGFMGGIMPAVEKRIKAVVLNVGGMEMQKALPEADQINFLPRITQPVLMLNGKYDMFFPVETSQKPMFDLLGTPPKDKKIFIYESGHLVPRTDFVREALLWYDQYLGPVKN